MSMNPISNSNKSTKLALSTSDAFLNYPMPGDDHHNDENHYCQ